MIVASTKYWCRIHDRITRGYATHAIRMLQKLGTASVGSALQAHSTLRDQILAHKNIVPEASMRVPVISSAATTYPNSAAARSEAPNGTDFLKPGPQCIHLDRSVVHANGTLLSSSKHPNFAQQSKLSNCEGAVPSSSKSKTLRLPITLCIKCWIYART